MDPETGLIYLQARYYDPATAQFLSRDPLDPVTKSAYGYVDSNPLNGADPSGLDWCVFSNSNGCIGLGKIVHDGIHALDTGYHHTNVSAGFCVIACINVGFQGGHVYYQAGAWGIATPGINIDATTRTFSCQETNSFQAGGGIDFGLNGSVGVKPNGEPDWGDLQGGLTIKPGGLWIGRFSPHQLFRF